jgi:hypothetical protein
MERNAYCGLCGECLRTCTQDNVAVNLRLPGSDLLVAHGWKLDEAYKAFIMLACAAIYPVVFLGPWGWLKAWANLGTLSGFAVYALGFLVLNLVAVPALHLGIAVVTRWASGLQDIPLRRVFVGLSYTLVPLGLAAWMAFTVSLVFANLSYALPVLSDPFGWGWNLFGTAKIAWTPLVPHWGPYLQVPLLLIGLSYALKTGRGHARRLFGAGTASLKAFAPVAAVLTACVLFFLWLYVG